MTAAFIVQLDTGSDTDFLGIADDIKEAVETKGFTVLECKPWSRQSLSGRVLPAPSVAPTNITQQQ